MTNELRGRSARIAIVCTLIARHDAISSAVHDTYDALANDPGFSPLIFATRCDYDDLPVRIVSGISDLLLQKEFIDSDLVIYHFGFHRDLFDALNLFKGRKRQIVRFHNITPISLAPAEFQPAIEKSFRQIQLFRSADEIWADSEVNAQVLCEQGINESQIRVIPLTVESPALIRLQDKATLPLSILFIGRFVPSKGVLDLIEAVHLMCRHSRVPFRLDLAGNLEWANSDYLRRIERAIAAYELGEIVEFHGTVDDATYQQLLRKAHILAIPSYHEGFCKPVIEALRSGAIPVGYAAYNLPAIANGFGRMVPTGDTAALADALAEVTEGIDRALTAPTSALLPLDRGPTSVVNFDAGTRIYVDQFTPARLGPITRQRVCAVLTNNSGAKRIAVVPDNILRDQKRESLNRLCSLSDWSAWGELSNLMKELNDSVCIHRKSWEYALCIAGLQRLGVVFDEAKGLAVGAGCERPLYYLANKIAKMVATDLYDNQHPEGTPAMLENPERFAPFPYRKDHLQVLRMSGDNLKFADRTFDFVFSLSSIEHFGSRETQRRALNEMTRVTRRAGIICVATELLLNDSKHHEYFTLDELEEMFLHAPGLQLDGGELDLRIAQSLMDYPIDLDRSNNIEASPHITLKQGDNLWTSVMLFLRKVSD